MKLPLLKITTWPEMIIMMMAPEGQLALEEANSH